MNKVVFVELWPLKGPVLQELVRGLLLLGGLLGKKNGLDVGDDTTLSDGDTAEKLGQLFIVSDGELEMSRNDSRLLVVSGGVASEFNDLSGEVLEDSGHVDGSASADSVSPVASSKHSVDSANGELESSSSRSGLALDALCSALGSGLLSFSGHFSFLTFRVVGFSKCEAFGARGRLYRHIREACQYLEILWKNETRKQLDFILSRAVVDILFLRKQFVSRATEGSRLRQYKRRGFNKIRCTNDGETCKEKTNKDGKAEAPKSSSGKLQDLYLQVIEAVTPRYEHLGQNYVLSEQFCDGHL